MSYDEHLITQAGGGDPPTHGAPVGLIVDTTITVYQPGKTPVEVRFTNVPLSIVEEAIAHVNDNGQVQP